MARPIILSNGELNVGLNIYGQVHDFYFPYVGQENHTAAKHLRHRIGVWIAGEISWLDDGSWDVKCRYHHDVLIGHIVAKHEGMAVTLVFDDFVDSSSNTFMRNIHIVNDGDEREIKLFMHQVFILSDSYGSDTVQYLPEEKALLHYKGHRSMIVGAAHGDGRGFDQYSVGLFGIEGHEGTYRDADDGELSGNAVEHGRVDSVIGLNFDIPAASSARATYWVAAATTRREALRLHQRAIRDGVLHALLKTTTYWRHWIKHTLPVADHLERRDRDAMVRSALLLKAHQDRRGAVMASVDTTMLNYWRDAYTYCWPRDGAYAVWPLIRLGYQQEPLQFFSFCRRGLHESGYLMHKYQADGSIGSSWHPYVRDGVDIAPIQEDETAIVLFLFGQYYQQHSDKAILKEYYPTLLAPMANFLASFIEETTGLPKPSFDLWEQKFLTSTYTTAVVSAALIEAATLADALEETDDAVRWRTVGEDMQSAARQQLFNQKTKFFYNGLSVSHGEIAYDEVIDASSFYGAFMFGLFEMDSNEIKQAYETMLLKLSNGIGSGLIRYEGDDYLRTSSDAPSNAWFITTLWHAQYAIESGDRKTALYIVDWVMEHALPSGMLSEQIKPDGRQSSVSPLAWSHAELLSTLLDIAIEPEPQA